MILMTGRLIRIRHTTLSVNSNSQILVPQNGMCFTCFCSRTSMASGNALSPPTLYVVLLHPSLKHKCRAFCGPEYDKTPPAAINHSCSPLPPRVCRSSAVRHLATSPMQCSTLRQHALHLSSSVITTIPRCFSTAHSSCPARASVHTYIPAHSSSKLRTRRNCVLSVFAALGVICLHLFIFSAMRCLWVPVA